MLKIFALVLVVWGLCGAWADDSLLLNKLTEKSARQKRLLFYDGQGQLVNTYGNSIYRYGQNEQENLFHWSFLNNFLSPIFPTLSRTTIAYMVPVSDAVSEQINKDPMYQNKLVILTYKDPLVEINPLCSGRRAQIPSPNLCSNFLNCWDGWAFEQECPAGLLFSKDGFCDYPQNVNCNNRKLKEPLNPLCSKEFEAFRNVADCSEFFVCVNSLPVRFKCPADLAYSETLGICDYPGRVVCNFTQSTTSNASSNIESEPSTEATSTASSSTAASTAVPITTLNDDKSMLINKLEYNTQSWSSTHVAFSRQDAIRQLQLGKIAHVSVDN